MQHYLVVPLVLFSTAIPMPFGASGVTEQVSKTLFQNLAGFASGDLAMLGLRAIMYATGLIGVMVYLANLNQVRTLREEP
jgi:glycosyltransferase 2 family protein